MKRISLWVLIGCAIMLAVPGAALAQGDTQTISTEIGLSIHYPSAWQALVFPGNTALNFNGYSVIMFYGQKRPYSPPTSDVTGPPFTMLGQTVYPQWTFSSMQARNARTPTGINYNLETSTFYFDTTLMNLNAGDLPIPPDIQMQVQNVLANITQGSNPIPQPTATPFPVTTNYHIEYFVADHTLIPAGGCFKLSYWAVGAQQITLQSSNSPNNPEIISDNPNGRTICLSAAGNSTPGQSVVYTLKVTYLNGQTESRSLTITVGDAAEYAIKYFSADRTTIPAGDCIRLSYWVMGAQRITLQGSNWPNGPETILDNPNGRTICPSAEGNYNPGRPVIYTLNVTYLNGQTDSRTLTITVAVRLN